MGSDEKGPYSGLPYRRRTTNLPSSAVVRPLKPLRAFKILAVIFVASFLSVCLPLTLGPTFTSILFGQNASEIRISPQINSDPAENWKDDVWPIRSPSEPWDISVDYSYPRSLKYDVEEGTWLRIDIHPKTGDIVFDMLGDLYCLPASAYTDENLAEQGRTSAYPVLLGVPYDSDPHFSPSGEHIVFRSDAGLGVENIWIMSWTGCVNMNLRPNESSNVDTRSELAESLPLKEYEDRLLASGVKETEQRRRRRWVREGRFGARRITNETYRWVSDARFHPSGKTLVATKWYTSSRSLGAGEGWEYSVSSTEPTIAPGSGKRLVGRTLPTGWSSEQYGDQQIGPEQFVWRGHDTLIYSMNVRDRDSGAFTYSKDVHKGIYAIFARNLTTNVTETLVDAFPGGASRPELSRDQRTLAFVRRVGDKEMLVLKDLETGTIRHAWDGLTYDLTTVSAPMGTYPSFAFTPDDRGIVIWAAGQIYLVPLSVNSFGEKIKSLDRVPRAIPFSVHIEKQLAETVKAKVDLVGLETGERTRARAMKNLVADEKGEKVLFQAAGRTYVHDVDSDPRAPPVSAQAVPVLREDRPYYSPSFVPGHNDLVLHARWDDQQFTSFELANLTSDRAWAIKELPLGRYVSPILCECPGNSRRLLFVKTGGDLLTGDIVATAKAGLWMAQIQLPSPDEEGGNTIAVENLRYVKTEIDLDDLDGLKMRFVDGSSKLLIQQSRNVFVVDIAAGPNTFGEYQQTTLARGRMSTEMAISPRTGSKGKLDAANVAFVDFHHVYVVPGANAGDGVWSKPGHATKGLARLSLDGGHSAAWTRDGGRIFWFLGPYLHSLEVAKLKECGSAIEEDQTTFGISCVTSLVEYQELIVSHSTDIARLRQEAEVLRGGTANADVLVVTNATVLSMSNGDVDGDLYEGGVVITRGGIIESVGLVAELDIPEGATVIDAQGGYVIPGFIDGHAHWNGFDSLYPARSWELETFLAYGVTTLHNPSASTVNTYDERSRVESGQLVGPRIFQTGEVIYGAGSPALHQDIVDMAEAYSALVRIKAEGGPASFSYKNYNLPSRASRQRLLLAARNLSMLCVPEGGMNLDWDLTYILDGMTTVEHALPVPVLYDDVLTLYALSGTASTPTHVVNYGGAFGEQYVWATEDVPRDPKLRRFTKHDVLEGLTESTARPRNSYALFNTSASVAKMVGKGLHALIGAHGEPPLGLNYHAEMFFTRQGGLSNYEVLRAATSDAAQTLGLYDSLGSLSAGKLADFLIYPPRLDLLGADIQETRNLRYIARGGRVWDAESMVEFWPVEGRRGEMPPFNP